jgi:hypothetical protein
MGEGTTAAGMSRDGSDDVPGDRGWDRERVAADGGIARPDTGAADGRPAEGRRAPAPPRLDESCPVAAAIRDGDHVGQPAHVGPPREGRFGLGRRVRTADSPARIDVRAFRPPEGDLEGFVDAVRGQLHRWATVSDVDGVVPVVERGLAERPWVATAGVGPSLDGRETPSLERALRGTIHLADALATCHERGLVHAGVEPANVVFTHGPDGPATPALHNLGLVDVYRRYEDPARVLDPRYAAPEFFGSEEGIVDRATDVYGLGAVCYRLVTGTPPVSGSAAAIAERVTDEEPFARPSRLSPDLPAALDDVLLRATETDKFARYDTARAFRTALEGVLDEL